MTKGSVTIFTTLSMVLVAATLFSLLEGMRFFEINRLSQLQTELATEAFFANYNANLWQEYHLLGSDGTNVTERLRESGNARNIARDKGLNLFLTEVETVDLESYTRITDGNGAVYVHAVSTYMEEQMLYETLKILYNQYEVIQALIQSSEIDLTKIDEALVNIEEAQRLANQQREELMKNQDGVVEEERILQSSAPVLVNPIQEIKNLQEKGILEVVLSSTDSISKKELSNANLVSKRQLYEGKNYEVPESAWMDKVLLQQYLLSYFSNYLDSKENTYLSYELEYIIGGKSSETENLKQVVYQILAIREAVNFLYLVSDIEKAEEAKLLAIGLVGASMNPLIIESVKIGLLTAWAFGESILDARALLNGKQIPLLKSKDTWTLSLSEIGKIGKSDYMAKESMTGLTYQNYLGILLLFQRENGLAMHAMDLQEMNIKSMWGEPAFQMDHMWIQTDVKIVYKYRPLFSFFQNYQPDIPWKNQAVTKTRFGYY